VCVGNGHKTMDVLTDAEFNLLIKDAKLMKEDGFGPKVYRRPDATYVKLFRQKRKFSLSAVWPYVKRFRSNSLQLKKHGIDTVKVDALYNCPSIERTVITYQELPGELFRKVLEHDSSNQRIEQLAEFLAVLHQNGIYFRSIHLENIVLQENGKLGLIDIADMRFRWLALSPLRRVRNLCHMLKYKEDTQLLLVDGKLDHFLYHYIDRAKLGLMAQHIFALLVQRYLDPNFKTK